MVKLIRLKTDAPEHDSYIARRVGRHGWLYFDMSPEFSGLVSARSVSTGVLCTFLREHVEEASDA